MDTLRLLRAGAMLDAEQLYENWDMPTKFVKDEHDDFWSVIGPPREPIVPVMRHTFDGWVAAIFHRGYGYIKIVAPGDILPLPRGQTVIARIHRQGVRWEFANPPS